MEFAELTITPPSLEAARELAGTLLGWLAGACEDELGAEKGALLTLLDVVVAEWLLTVTSIMMLDPEE